MNPLQYLEEPLKWTLDFLHENLDLSYGWAIVVLTVIVRTLLLPLVVKQYRSMRDMQRVAPQLKELQRKYKGNKQKLNEEMMKFYRENEVNPFASCLPILFQLPIFFALYYTLRSFSKEGALDGTDPSFMWVIPDISQRITEIGWGAAVVLGVYGISQLLSTELSSTPQTPDIQRRLFRVLPVFIIASFFMFDTFPLPAGLVLYWATTNLWTAGQQLVMRHRIGLHLSEPAADGAPAATPGKRSSRTAPKDAPAAVEAGEATEAPEAVEVPEGGAGEERAKRRRQPRRQRAADAVLEEGGDAVPEEDAAAPAPTADVSEDGAESGDAGDADTPDADKAPARSGTPAKRRQPKTKRSSGSRGGRKQPRRRR